MAVSTGRRGEVSTCLPSVDRLGSGGCVTSLATAQDSMV